MVVLKLLSVDDLPAVRLCITNRVFSNWRNRWSQFETDNWINHDHLTLNRVGKEKNNNNNSKVSISPWFQIVINFLSSYTRRLIEEIWFTKFIVPVRLWQLLKTYYAKSFGWTHLVRRQSAYIRWLFTKKRSFHKERIHISCEVNHKSTAKTKL